MGYVHSLYDIRELLAALQKWKNCVMDFRILALWLLSVLLKMCASINRARKAGGWMKRGFDYYLVTVRRKWKILMLQ